MLAQRLLARAARLRAQLPSSAVRDAQVCHPPHDHHDEEHEKVKDEVVSPQPGAPLLANRVN